MRLASGTNNVLVISDLQIPFQHVDYLQFLSDLYDHIGGADKVVIIGDLLDSYALSNYASDPDGMSAGDELIKSLAVLQELYDMFPKATVIYGNHDVRLYKRAFNAGIPAAAVRSLKELLQAPDTWDFKEHEIIDGVVYEHGDRAGGVYAAKRLAIVNQRSTVIGHHHSHAAVMYIANRDSMIFGMNVGCLCNMDTYAFRYAKRYASLPTMGAGTVVKGVPQFHPLTINNKGRYNGKIG